MATAWSTFWGLTQNAYALQNNRVQHVQITNHLFRRQSMRVARALAQGLIGAASGSNVTDTRTRIQGVQTIGSVDNLGGKRLNETVTNINRNTTAADVTFLKNATGARISWPSSYPTDKSGNGGVSLSGGSKLGF